MLLRTPIGLRAAQRGAHVVTDLEGRRDSIDALITAGKMRMVDNRLDFVDDADRLYFAGDITDRGPHTLRLISMLLDLRCRYSERVAWVYGNLDVKNLGLLRNLPLLERRTPDYEDWLLAGAKADTDSNQRISMPSEKVGREAWLIDRNTLDRRVEYWLCRQGAAEAFKFHRIELAELTGRQVSRLEAAEDYLERLLPGGETFEFLRLGQVGIVHGNVLIDHGGVSRTNIGFVPGATGRFTDALVWLAELNAFAQDQMTLIEKAIRAHGLGEHIPDTLLRYADAIWDATVREGSGALFMNDVSLIYPFRQLERGNFRAPDAQTIAFLERAGIDTEIVGHSPFGDVPGPLKADGFLRLMADTSHRRAGASSTITIDSRGGVRVRGRTSQGVHVYYRVTARSPPPIGQVTLADGYTVVGRTRLKGATHYLVTKYFDGYSIRDRLLDRAQLAAMQPQPAVARSGLQEQQRHHDLLVEELQRKGKRILTLRMVEELVGERTPVVVCGFSKFGHSPMPEAMIDAEARALVGQLACLKQSLIITGGTDNGFERAVHLAARDAGHEVIGFIQQGAIAGEIDLVEKVAFAGAHQDWAGPLLAALTLAASKKGIAVFVGGGSFVGEGIAHAADLGMDYFLLRKSPAVEGPGGASSQAATQMNPDEQARRTIGSLNELGAALWRGDRSILAGRTSRGELHGARRVGVYAGSFDPPHEGHRELVLRIRVQFKLDLVYVVADRAMHYKPMQELVHRVRMTELLFQNDDGVCIPAADPDEWLGDGEMWDVLLAVRERHPDAEIFNIVGSDTLRWYVALAPEHRPTDVRLLVNDRHDGLPLPSSLDGRPVLTIDCHYRGPSSTRIRQDLREGRRPRGLTPEVLEYARLNSLYLAPQSIPHEA